MRITVDLSDASEAEKAKFSVPQLSQTLNALRAAIGDPNLEIKVRGMPGGTVFHVVQSLEQLKEDVGNPIEK